MTVNRKQPYRFLFMDTALAEAGGVALDALHCDVDAICRCYDAIRPVAERLGVERPRPKLAGFSYAHLSTLGAPVVFTPDSEPAVLPLLREAREIDSLREPRDYMACGVLPERLRLTDELVKRCPDAIPDAVGGANGPITTAALLMGPRFFTLPHEDPERAHRLISFCTESILNYEKAKQAHFGQPEVEGPVGICDDFAGIFAPETFAEFVLPAWERIYQGHRATQRHLHSELLRLEHLRFFRELRLDTFDPSADQYLTPELLREHCPVPFMTRILCWHIENNSPSDLEAMYRRIAGCEPYLIGFEMTFLRHESKIAALLRVARELEG